MPLRLRADQIGGDDGIKADVFKSDAFIEQDMQIVFDVMPDEADVRVFEQRFKQLRALCLSKLAIEGIYQASPG